MADFDATQAIDLSDCDDVTDDEVADEDKKPVAHLKVLSHKGFPETSFPIYDGNNVVGRQEGSCNVLIPLKALSKQHACIEVRGEQHFLVDKGSRNKTRRGKMFLLPEAKYELQSGDQLMFADISCVYMREGADNVTKVRNDVAEKNEDSGSETGSESMLLPEEEAAEKALIEETIYEEASDPSSDLLQPTQAFPADGIGLDQLPTSTSVPDSDPETDPTESTQNDSEPVTVAETPAILRTKGVVGETKGEKHVTMALTEKVTYCEEEEDEEEEVKKERVTCELTQVYDSGGETDEGEGFNENRRSSIFEAATQVCVDFEAETQVCVDFEAETQVCVDFEAETQVVADPEAAGDNVSSEVDYAVTSKKKSKDVNVISKLVSASGDADKNEGKSMYSDSDSSSGSPVFPSSLGREEEGNCACAVTSSKTTSLYMGVSPTLGGKQQVGDAEFTRPFPVANRTPIGAVVKSRLSYYNQQQDGSPVQLPTTVTSDVTSDATVCSAQTGVADMGSVVESPEGSTGFEPKMHSTQIGGKSSHDDSFPSLRLDTSQQDVCLPCSEGSLRVSTDDVCTQAYGNDVDDNTQGEGHGIVKDDVTAGGADRGGTGVPESADTTQGVASKEKYVALNSDDICTQAYGNEEEIRVYPTKGSNVINSDDVSTQAYGEEGATNNPSKGRHIVANSDDISTQAYGEEDMTDYPNKRGCVTANSDDISTQAYGEEGATNYPSKGRHIAANSDVISTQAYGEEDMTDYPNKRGRVTANSDDISTQAYGEEGATNYPSKGRHIAANSDVISTQAYGEEDMTDYPNKRGRIAANSDDISTQAYGEEGTADYPNKGGRSGVNSDDVCTQAYNQEETASLRSSPRKRRGGKRIVPTAEDLSTNSGSDRSEVVESSQPGEDQEEEEDILMPLCVGKHFSRSAVRRAETLSETRSLGGIVQQLEGSATVSGQQGRISRRTQSQGPAETTPVATRRRRSLGTEVVGSTTREEDGTDEPKPRKSARRSRGTAGDAGGPETGKNLANEVTASTLRRTRRVVDIDVDLEPVKKPKLSVKEQKETKTRSAKNGNAKKSLVSTAAGEKESETLDEEGTGEKVKEESESETRSKRSRRSVVGKLSKAAAQEESEQMSEHIKQKLSKVAKEGETKPRSTRNRRSVVNKPSDKEENETNTGEHIEEKPLVIKEQSESKPRSASNRRSVNETRLQTGQNETNDGEQEANPPEVSKAVSRMSKRSAEKPAMTVRSKKSVIEKSTVSVVTEQEATKTRNNKLNVNKKPPVAEEQVKGSRQSARRRTSLVPEQTQPKTSRTTSERESIAETESKTTSAQKVGDLPETEQTENAVRSVRNRKQIEEKPAIAAKQKESENNGELHTESKTWSKRKRESTVGNAEDSSMPHSRSSARRSSVNVTKKNKNKSSKVKATPDPTQSPKQKENVLVGKSPKRRQTSLAPSTDGDSSQPCKKSRGRQLPVVPPSNLSTSLRERHLSRQTQVMFTGMFDSHGEQILKNLGGQIVDSVYKCTHLVTDRVRRTVKFLCGLGRGIPIVGPGWLLSCREANTFTDFERFLVHDEETERKFHFNLATSLRKAASGGLLVGYRIHVTANVKPEPKQMKDIIQCAGGEYLASVPRTYQEKTVVVSCDADRASGQRTLQPNIPVVSAEFLLTGILRQEIDIDQHQLAPVAPTTKGGRSSRKKR